MKVEHFRTIHVDRLQKEYKRGVRQSEMMNIIGHTLRRWQVIELAKQYIDNRDYFGAAYLLGFADAMCEAVKVRKHKLKDHGSLT